MINLAYSRSTRRGGAARQVLVYLLCTAVVMVLGWIVLLPGLVTSVIQHRTGFPAKIDYLYANPFTGELQLRGLLIMNPEDFGGGNCLDVKQFSATADLFSLLGHCLVIERSTIDVAQVSVVINAQGLNNLDLIARRLDWGGNYTKSGGGVAAANASSQFLVRNLDLRLGEVVFKDERPGQASERVRQLAFQRSYRDISTVAQLSADLPAPVADAAKEAGQQVSGYLKLLLNNAGTSVAR